LEGSVDLCDTLALASAPLETSSQAQGNYTEGETNYFSFNLIQ
jgi:hypothetical protein